MRSAAELLSAAFVGLVTKRHVTVVTERSCRFRQQRHVGSGAVPSVVHVHHGFVFKGPRERAFSLRRTFLSDLIVARTRKCSERGRLCKDARAPVRKQGERLMPPKVVESSRPSLYRRFHLPAAPSRFCAHSHTRSRGMSDEDEKAMLLKLRFPAVTEVSLGPRYSVRCRVRFSYSCLFRVQRASKRRSSSLRLFCYFSFSLQGLKRIKSFFTSHTQMGRGFETALTSRRLTNHHIHVDAKREGYKKCGDGLERRSRVFYWDTWSACVSYFSM